MWRWLWGHPSKLTPGHLSHTLERLLASAPNAGEEPFALTEKEMLRLCSAASKELLKNPSLLEISTPAACVVVGDLHGQFTDLQRIFQQLGRPGSDDRVWVFLGDYVDRGPMGLEVVATLLCLKLLHPRSIHLLRGNHECADITAVFGFLFECQRRSTLAAWEAVIQMFDALPLAAVLNGRVFLCHGGISPLLGSPQDINAIERPLNHDPNEEGLLCDLLWSDPSPHVQGWRPNPRFVSWVFGLDVAREWLRAQGMRSIVRAHMVQECGYEVLGANEVVTVFSASNYRQTGNTGAVLNISPPDSMEFSFVTFPALRSQAPPSNGDAEEAGDGAVSADGQDAAELVAGSSNQPQLPRPARLSVSADGAGGATRLSPFAAAFAQEGAQDAVRLQADNLQGQRVENASRESETENCDQRGSKVLHSRGAGEVVVVHA